MAPNRKKKQEQRLAHQKKRQARLDKLHDSSGPMLPVSVSTGFFDESKPVGRQTLEEYGESLRETLAQHRPDFRFVHNPAGLKPMSEVLGEFIEPFTDLTEDLETFQKLLNFAALVWNLTLMPPKQGQESLTKLLKNCPPEGREMIGMLIHRKLSEFAHVSRMIVDVKARDEGGQYQILVTSTLPMPMEEDELP